MTGCHSGDAAVSLTFGLWKAGRKSIPGSQFLEPTALKQKPRLEPETTVRPESWKKVLSMILWRFTVAVGWHAVALQVVLSFVGHVLLNMLFFLLTLPLSTFPPLSPIPAISHLSVCLCVLLWLSHCVFVCLCVCPLTCDATHVRSFGSNCLELRTPGSYPCIGTGNMRRVGQLKQEA